MQRRQRGTTIQGVTREDVTSLSILLPPLPEQRAIVAVLDSIDVAIERIEAVIATTEQLRDSLLHELLTHGIPGWHTDWKDALGVGTIPACWEVVRLGDVAPMSQGGTARMSRPEYWDGDIPIVTGADLTGLRIAEFKRPFVPNCRRSLFSVTQQSANLAPCCWLQGRLLVLLVWLRRSWVQARTSHVSSQTVEQSQITLCKVLLRLGPSLQRRQRGTTIQGVTREDRNFPLHPHPAFARAAGHRRHAGLHRRRHRTHRGRNRHHGAASRLSPARTAHARHPRLAQRQVSYIAISKNTAMKRPIVLGRSS